jgi:hypothetical protein
MRNPRPLIDSQILEDCQILWEKMNKLNSFQGLSKDQMQTFVF